MKYKVKDIDRGYGKIKRNLKELMGKRVTVGVQAQATTEDGGLLARVAALHEFGGEINMPAHDVTVYRQVNKKGTDFNKKGRFVRAEKANFATTHHADAYTVTIPERSFLRSAFDENKEKIEKFAHGRVKDLIQSKTAPDEAMRKIGENIEGIVKKKIAEGPFTPNAPGTVRRKKSSRPLIDTGRLRQSVRYAVKNKNEGG